MTAENLDDADIAFNVGNLECLCQACHNLEHEHFEQVGAVFGSSGDVVSVRQTKEQLELQAARKAALKF